MERKANFIKKAREKFGDYYSYNKFDYVNAKTKGIITCPIHGDFEQNPDKHINSTYPCPKCFIEHRSKVMKMRQYKGEIKKDVKPFSYFVKKAEEKFGKGKFDYKEETYKGMTSKMTIICNSHGEFEKTPHSFLISNFGCTKCSSENRANTKTKDYEDFLNEAERIHDRKYTYPLKNKETYSTRKSIITIICDKHGEFKKSGQKHLSGQGCFLCRIEELVEEGQLVGGYNEELFASNRALANDIGVLYYLEINNGECYKIGISKNSGRDRARALKHKSSGDITHIKVLNEYKGTLEEVYNLEQKILKEFSDIRLYNKPYSTELFKEDIRDKELFKSIFN